MRTPRSGMSAILGDPSCVVPVFQPVVEPATGRTAGYEALARWPGLPDISPLEAFDAARRGGSAATMDWWCRRRAVEGVHRRGPGTARHVFVNVEPDCLAAPPPWGPTPVLTDPAGTETGVRVVLELTERTLLQDPPAVIAGVEWARALGFGIALDDVGALPECLALLDVIAPDVVKLDRSLTQMSAHGLEAARAINAAGDLARRRGSVILAEGVETDEHEDCALSMGATLAQGYRYGRPGPLPERAAEASPIRIVDSRRGRIRSLPDILDDAPTAVGDAREAVDACALVESLAASEHRAGCVVATMHGARHLSAEIAGRYRGLSGRHAFVGISAPGLGPSPRPGVRGPRSPELPDPGAFAVASIGADHAVAVLAAPLVASDPRGSVRWCITTDRDVVADIARAVIGTLAPR
ncbi:EAL domain-containing protein [Williamsia serinedens]|nr:EAL domain-containing protein [Williamsia serinedens]